MWNVQLFKLNFDDRERDAAAAVVTGGWLTMGERIRSFETSFADFLGCEAKCTAVSNGTAALHMALLALDIGTNDEVIIPALTFIADANVVTMVGAKAVLADCTSMDDWNVSAESIEAKITSRTKAIIIVHYAGFPCDMIAISKLCHERGIKLIEDVAHAPGASILGRSCGTWGDISCFSFFSNKNLSIGEGGMVATGDEGLHKRLGYLRSHGMTTLTLDRHKGRAVTYDVAEAGLNYRMDEIRAAIGLVQLEKLPEANVKRGELTARYRANLEGSQVQIPFEVLLEGSVPVYHILPILLPENIDRLLVIEAMKSRGIQSSIHYPPFWSFSAYQGCFNPNDTPIVAEICNRELTLPLYPTMTDDEVNLVCKSLLEALREQL